MKESQIKQLWANYSPNSRNKEAFWAEYERGLAQLKKAQPSAAQPLAIAQQAVAVKPPAKETPLAVFKPKKSAYNQRVASLLIAPLSIFLYATFADDMGKGEALITFVLMLAFGVLTPLLYASSAYVFSIAKSGLYIARTILSPRKDYFAWRDVYGVEILEDTKNGEGKHVLVLEPYQGEKQSFVYHLSREEHRDFVKMVSWQVAHFSCHSEYYPV